MAVAAAIDTPDLGASLHRFLNAAQAFFASIADLAWGYLAAALLLSLALQLARAHGWANALRAAYPKSRVSETGIAAAFLVGAGMNGILPAHGGDALKIVLARRSVERSSYPTIVSSFAGNWTGVFNIGTGVPTSVNTLIAELAKVLGPAPEIRHAPERAGGVELDRSCLDSSKAARTGLWRPKTTLRDGLKETARVA